MSQQGNWLDFWQSREITSYRDTVWRMNMEYFVRATTPIMQYSAEDVVLDIGCGAGYLQELLHPRVREIHGADISRRYLDYCTAKFRGVENCHFHKLDEGRYTDLGTLPTATFTKIICLSVVQYYDEESDLEDLVHSLQRVAAPGALCLIADMPTTGATGADALSLLALAARERHLFATLRYLVQMRLSTYHEVRATQGVLEFQVSELNALADRLGVAAQVLDDQLTVNKSRSHWLLRF